MRNSFLLIRHCTRPIATILRCFCAFSFFHQLRVCRRFFVRWSL